ncbi:hypothetical protein ESA94_17755 [Lacibacter luteus]|uniref:Uncharacterized protein n=1 Tax=Lacibacter luteus TaxID=2508719 RepID=A0A4Q1CFP0_9BACT|nr:hypothetical protein [Lacibacter luteus]RXK58482.1 hypothetical protein ESA94_17755 [Lacibacter luteus]
MKNKRVEAAIIFFTGLLLLVFAWFVYAVYEPVPDPDSPRLERLNALINTIGQLPSAILFGGIGLLVCMIAVRKWRR